MIKESRSKDEEVFVQGHNISVGSFRSSSHQPSETSYAQGLSSTHVLDFDKQIIRDSNLQLVLSHKRKSTKRHQLSPYAADEQGADMNREVTPAMSRKLAGAPY